MPEELSLQDIATKICDHYHELKKESNEKRSVLFLQAVNKFFIEWAQERDYTLEEFKSRIGTIIQDRKRGKKLRKTVNIQEEMEICQGLNKKIYLNGSTCFSFTFKQIAAFGLNPDSYL